MNQTRATARRREVGPCSSIHKVVAYPRPDEHGSSNRAACVACGCYHVPDDHVVWDSSSSSPSSSSPAATTAARSHVTSRLSRRVGRSPRYYTSELDVLVLSINVSLFVYSPKSLAIVSVTRNESRFG